MLKESRAVFPDKMSKELGVMLVQLDTEWHEKERNFSKVERLVESSFDDNVNVIVLPEMFATGFSMETNLAEDENGITFSFLRDLARKYKSYLIGGYTKKQGDERPKNTAVVFDSEGRKISEYEKIHLFSFAEEDKFYSSGGSLSFFEIDGFKSSLAICYDLRFPELFRLMIKNKPEIVFVVANWPEKRQIHWNSLLRARAIENQFYVCGVNRVGSDPKNSYVGGSTIIDPRGNYISLDNSVNPLFKEEGAIIGRISQEEVLTWRDEFRALQDMKLI